MTPTPFRRQTLSALLVACVATFTANAAFAGTPQVMIVTSDPQYPWTDKTDRGQQESQAEKETRSRALITEQYESIAAYRAARPGLDIPVVINGDLTAFGHSAERAVMTELYTILGDNVFLGLGNHDYKNNVGDCALNNCAEGSIDDLITRMKPLGAQIRSFDLARDPRSFLTEYTGSLSYTFTPRGFPNVLNVQMHNYPGYEKNFASVTTKYRIESGVSWMDNVLSYQLYQTNNDYHFGLVHMHDSSSITDEARKALQQQKVKAIFAGHFHGRMGFYNTVGTIPVYLSGSASQRTYLIVEYDRDQRMLRIFGVRDNDPENKSLIDEIAV